MSARANTGFLANLNPLIPLRRLTAHRELLWQFTQRTFHARHKGSTLGVLWVVFNPLLLLGLYFVFFRLIFKGRFGVLPEETPVDYALALLIGLTVFQFLAEVIAQSPLIITGSPNLVKKVVFPLEVLPVANLATSFFNFLISLGLVALGQLIFGRGLPVTVLWVPVIVFPVVLLGLGLSWALAAFGVFFRDIAQITQFVSLLLMYSSAVFYSSQHVPEEIWVVLRFNPLLHAIELMRAAMLWEQPLSLLRLGCLYAGSIVVCLGGHACFAKLRPAFSDVI